MIDQSERPWGRWIKVDEGDRYWVKKIEVLPNARLSLQFHGGRNEKWIIVEGYGCAVVNGNEIHVTPGTMVDIAIGDIHRMCAGDKGVTFIEVAYGPDLREDDIVRVEDDFGRS